MRLLHLVLLALTLGLLPLRAQELRATVELRTEALGSEGQIHYEGLRRQLTDLLGRTRWTDLAYKEGERIDVSFIFTLHERSELVNTRASWSSPPVAPSTARTI